jgi:hypothetical protein
MIRRSAMILLLATASAWVAGTVALIGAAIVLFRHAPGHDHPTGDFQFVDHDAPGIVFGDVLAHWNKAVSLGLLPLLVIGVAGGLFVALGRKRTAMAALWVAALLVTAALHAWSVSVTARMNALIADIHAGRDPGDGRREFKILHGQSMSATAGETLVVLLLGVAAAWSLLRRDPSASPDGG